MAISVSQESGTVAVQMVNGAIFRYDTGDLNLSLQFVIYVVFSEVFLSMAY